MKLRIPRINWPKTRLPPMNWFGLVAGVLMLVLPFLGPWWRAEVGTGAAEVALSPFDYSISLLGQPISSTLVEYFLLATKLSVIIGGTLMIAGSVGAKRWWSKRLARFGAMKVFWMLIGLILLLVLGAFFFNALLPSLLAGIARGTGPMPEGAGAIQLNVPYISGTTTSTIQMGPATLSAPITASLTDVFWVAVVVAALGIAARVYHRRFVKPEKLEKPKLKREKPE